MTGYADLRLAVCCTDRGQHDRAILGEVDVLPDGRLLASSDELLGPGYDADDIGERLKAIPHLRELGAPYDESGEPNFERSTCRYDPDRDRIVFRCPRCRRNPQHDGEWVRAVIRAFNEADEVTRIAEIPALDISTIP